jgi:sec-independent protein translocase protein TatA
MGIGFWQIALVVVLFLLLFGRGKLPQLMGDLAEGIKSFKQGIRDDGADAGKLDVAEAKESKV